MSSSYLRTVLYYHFSLLRFGNILTYLLHCIQYLEIHLPDVRCEWCVKPCPAKSSDDVEELRDVRFPVSEKIAKLGAKLAVQLPKCNYCHF